MEAEVEAEGVAEPAAEAEVAGTIQQGEEEVEKKVLPPPSVLRNRPRQLKRRTRYRSGYHRSEKRRIAYKTLP